MTLVPDYREFAATDTASSDVGPRSSRVFWTFKRGFDLIFTTLILIPCTLFVFLMLLVLNPFLNPGPMFYQQKRMGRNCKLFRAVKFRTMKTNRRCNRGPNDPVETDRITPLGQFLRQSRFDELPQIINVYRGDMSLIGPRPDYFRHAHHYMRTIPDYRQRHMVRPGISGLAQTELGYAQGTDATRRKTAADIEYIRRAGFGLDTWILWRTLVTVARRQGT